MHQYMSLVVSTYAVFCQYDVISEGHNNSNNNNNYYCV